VILAMGRRMSQIDRPDDRPSPVEAAMSSEMRAILANAISVLCERDREIMSRRYGLLSGQTETFRQIAARVGRSARWVEKREKVLILALRVIVANGTARCGSEENRRPKAQ